MGQNLVPLVNIKIAGKWMFIPLKSIRISISAFSSLPFFAGHESFWLTMFDRLIYLRTWGWLPTVPSVL
jgi:hypothetical protein